MADKIRQYASTTIFAVLLFGALYVLLGQRLHFPGAPDLPTEVSNLPAYAFYSFLRMLAAYILALVFSIAYGMTAALRKGADRIMMPILDILQSVPVLGFFPAAVFFFITLFRGNQVGVEMASVFLIFTSQAWNMTFGVYESLTTIPKDVREAAGVYGLTGAERFRRLLLPACSAKLVYNSILSWAGGWYFLIATEIIAIGPVNFQLRGLGSFLVQTSQKGQIGLTFLGLGVLVFIIILMDVFLWRPLTVWSQKFRYEFAAPTTQPHYQRSILLRLFLRFRAWGPLRRTVAAGAAVIKKPFFALGDRISEGVRALARRKSVVGFWAVGRRATQAFLAVALIYLTYLAVVALIGVFSKPAPPDAVMIPAAIAVSFLRLALAYVIALAWTIPVAVKIGHSPKAASLLTPVFEVVASIPATALFPLMVLFIVKYTGSLDLAAIILILTGMQWYLLFNLIAGTSAIPHDLKEVAGIHQLRGWLYWRRVVLPALFPSIVTGSITAWGGGWNALIIAEYFKFGGRTFSTFGIGSLLDRATFETGNAQLMLLALVGMVVVIVSINRLFWRRLYTIASRRYTIEY